MWLSSILNNSAAYKVHLAPLEKPPENPASLWNIRRFYGNQKFGPQTAANIQRDRIDQNIS